MLFRSLTVRRTPSPSGLASVTIRSGVPGSSRVRLVARTSEKTATSKTPVRSENCTKAKRLPLAEVRSCLETTMPASLSLADPVETRERRTERVERLRRGNQRLASRLRAGRGRRRRALHAGGDTLGVDAVLLIGEHGDYPFNEKAQQLYPRRYFMEQICGVLSTSGRAVPVFNDKHLSWRWQEIGRAHV